MSKFGLILTETGKAKVANAQLTSAIVNLTQMAVGDSNGQNYVPEESMTALKNEKWRGIVNGVQIDDMNPNWIVIEAAVPANVGGFTIRELGIYDTEGELIAIGNTPESYKPALDEGSTKDLYLKAILEVSNASAINLKVDPSVIIASRKYVDDEMVKISDSVGQDVAQVTQQLAQKAEKDTVNTQLATKVSHDYFDSYMASVVDWAPKAAYTTIVALQAAYPDGASGVFLVQENGHAYSWINGAWESLGEYKANTNELADTKIYIDAKKDAIKSAQAQGGSIVNVSEDTITIANGSTGAVSYLMYRVKIDGKKLAGKTLRAYMHVDTKNIGVIYTALLANAHRGSAVQTGVGSNHKRLAQADGTTLYMRDIIINELDTEIALYFNLTNTVVVSSEQVLKVIDVAYELIDNSLFHTSNVLTIDKKLDDVKQELSLTVDFSKNGQYEASIIGGSGNSIDRSITATNNTSGTPYLLNKIKWNPIKSTLQIKMSVDVTTATTADINKILLLSTLLRDGTITNVNTYRVSRVLSDDNRLTVTALCDVTDTDTELRLGAQITNVSSLTSEMTIKLVETSYKIIDAENVAPNEIALKTILEANKQEIDVFKNATTDNSEVFLSVEHTNHVILKLTSVYDTSFRVYGVVDSEWLLLPVTNLATGHSFDYIVTLGEYYIDTSDIKRIKVVNKNSWQYALPFSMTASFKPLDKIAQQIYGYNYRAQAPKPIAKTSTPSSLLFLTAHDGKLYVSMASTIKYSDDDGLDGYTHTAGVVSDSGGVYNLRVLDNGNALAWGENGKVFHSGDNMQTWKEVLDMGNAKTQKAYGFKSYKNYVMFGSYNNVVDGATKAYISEDYGATVREVFDILNQPNFTPNGQKKHVHSVAIDPFETTIDGKPMLWVTIGDGRNQQMIFWSKDFGATWQQAAPFANAPVQSTEIIPLKNCVLFTSDARISGVVRYNRPKTGTRKGKFLDFEMPLLLHERWGYSGTTDVPIASIPAIDYERSLAYFGWHLNSQSKLGDSSGLFRHGEIYATDGYNFYLVHRTEQELVTANNLGVVDMALDGDRIIANVAGISGVVILNNDMWD